MHYCTNISYERILLSVKIPSITPYLNHNASLTSLPLFFTKLLFYLKIYIWYSFLFSTWCKTPDTKMRKGKFVILVGYGILCVQLLCARKFKEEYNNNCSELEDHLFHLKYILVGRKECLLLTAWFWAGFQLNFNTLS